MVETALLIALTEERGHGYALVARAQELVGDRLRVDPGGVYRILRALEDGGMVSSTWAPGEAGPQKRIYAIGPLGRELLSRWAGILAVNGEALTSLSRLARGAAESTETSG